MSTELGQSLLLLARNAICGQLGAAHPADPDVVLQPRLTQPGASFVTLTRDGELRGCIGSLEAHRPLHQDVAANALGAAFRDPRFAALTLAELADVKVEVSLLTPALAMRFADEADALGQLRPQVDGVILEYGRHRSTFLPQVWESLPEPVQFLAQLKRKAGLPLNFWSNELRLSRYQVEKWKEAH